MNFTLEFTTKDIIESRKLANQASFIFHKGNNKSHQLDMQISLLFSKSVQELICLDPTAYKFIIPDDTCSDDFFDHFMVSIESNSIHIENNQVRDFVSIVKILRVDCIKPHINSAILSLLCQPFDSENFTGDQEKFDFLCRHLNEMTIDIL